MDIVYNIMKVFFTICLVLLGLIASSALIGIFLYANLIAVAVFSLNGIEFVFMFLAILFLLFAVIAIWAVIIIAIIKLIMVIFDKDQNKHIKNNMILFTELLKYQFVSNCKPKEKNQEKYKMIPALIYFALFS